jgi:hypothetical protein
MRTAMQPSGTDALAALFLRDAESFDRAAKGLANQTVDFPITGNSMGTSLPKGTVVRVALGAGCNAGDIAVFRQQERIVAHRVIDRGTTHLITRGDARFAPDPPVPATQILGRVTGIVSSGGVDPLSAPLRRHVLARIAIAITDSIVVIATRVSPGLARGMAATLRVLERA